MSIDRKALVGFITEIEASRDRAKGETRHQSEILKKAREKGFEPKAMRKVLQRRAMSAVDRDSIDEAVDLYEHALGALATARDAVAGGMSAREAAEKYDVPRGALGVLVRGTENAISDPEHDAETGEITETADLANPPSDESRRHPVYEPGRQRALVTNSDAAPVGCVDGASSLTSLETAVPPCTTPQTDDVPALSVTPVPDEGVKGLAPFDPGPLPSRLDRRVVVRQGEHRGCSVTTEGAQ